MQRATLGLILFAIALVNYSSLHPDRTDFLNYRIKRFALCTVVASLLLIMQGVLGFCILLLKLNPVYHAVVGFLLIEAFLILVNTDILYSMWKNSSIKLGKETFDACIYVTVIFLFLDRTYTLFSRGLVITAVACLTILLIVVSFHLWRYYRAMDILVEPVTLSTPAKVFAFGCLLISASGVLMDIHPEIGLGGLFVSISAFFVTYVVLLKELTRNFIRYS
ncbi:hypothetical protein Arcve_0231 [Archaeoglobus veneficus SNP6]|uniref:Uncharacterized protein n=2 Tax=Archaeoglobus veneficus TaxID=58290 RepID=F2KNP0_ARCVS|nr:hypothetical protein Arcve_0231 [Archaeoglobus veneficus SNP6]